MSSSLFRAFHVMGSSADELVRTADHYRNADQAVEANLDATYFFSARENLLSQIKSKAVVHGKVVLSSGREADYYVDLRRVTLDAEAAPLVGEVMLDLTDDLEFDAVGGLTLGADPVAAAMLSTFPEYSRPP